MKLSKMTEPLPLVLLALVFFLVSTPVLAIDVFLKVNSSNELVIDDNRQKCQSTRKNCVDVKKGNSPFIHFKLPNACGDNADDPKYKLQEMHLSMVGNTGNNANPDKGFGKWDLPKPVFEDFNADKATGEVKFNGPNSLANNLIKVKDKNSAEYVVFFKIKAVACESGTVPAEIWLDPRIENGGRN